MLASPIDVGPLPYEGQVIPLMVANGVLLAIAIVIMARRLPGGPIRHTAWATFLVSGLLLLALALPREDGKSIGLPLPAIAMLGVEVAVAAALAVMIAIATALERRNRQRFPRTNSSSPSRTPG